MSLDSNRYNEPKNEPSENRNENSARLSARRRVERVMLTLSKNVPIPRGDVTLRRRRSLNPTSGSWILIDVSFQASLARGPGYRSDVEQ